MNGSHMVCCRYFFHCGRKIHPFVFGCRIRVIRFFLKILLKYCRNFNFNFIKLIDVIKILKINNLIDVVLILILVIVKIPGKM